MDEVSVWRPLSKFEADVAIARLEAEGIHAYYAGSLDRSYYPMGQVNVMVASADATRATEILESDEFELEAEPGHGVSPQRARRSAMVLLAVYVGIPLVLAAIVAAGTALITQSP